MPKPKSDKKESQLTAFYKKVQKLDCRLTDYERFIEDSLNESDRLVKEKKMLEEELNILKTEDPQIIYYTLDDDPLVDAINEIFDKYDSEESEKKARGYEARLKKKNINKK